jgi:group I intron endonuclease
MGFIYLITSPSGRQYVGQTINVKRRILSYKFKAKNYKGTVIILRSIKKYGWENHVFEIIEEVSNDRLDERERHWIEEFKTYIHKYPKERGLNLKEGGSGEGSIGVKWMHDIERRKKHSQKISGANNVFYGKRHSEETKATIGSKAKKRNLENGNKVPKWGYEKGLDAIRKQVLAYDLCGNFIKEYKSATDAGTELGIVVSCVVKVCKGKQTKAKGHIFRYKDGEIKDKISNEGLKKNKCVKRPILLLSPFGTVIKEYPSSIEASEDTKVNYGTIKWIARVGNMKPLSSGHIFIYKDTYESLNLN